MRAVRFGSYSMCATLAGTPSLSTRLKSISRYCRLWPPPWCRVVMRPWTLRPPFLGSGTSRDFSGVDRVISAKSATLEPRRPGVVGLYLRIAMIYNPLADRAAEGLDTVTVSQLHHGALGRLALTEAGARALALALAVGGVHRQHADVEDLLDRDLDLGLVRVRVDEERVPVLVENAVALLGDHGREDDVARVGDRRHLSSSLAVSAGTPRNSSSAAEVKTTSSATSTSYVFSWPASMRCTVRSLRSDTQLSSSVPLSTTSTLTDSVTLRRVAIAALVDGFSPVTKDSTTRTRPSRARSERAPRRAAAFIFLGVRWEWSRGTGPCTTPPPVNCGARIEPCRARPVPF